MKRLSQLADLRRGKLPDNLLAYASALSGFSQDAIDSACASFERARRQEGEVAFPELGAMIEACRRHSATPDTTWTVERYRQARDFDAYLSERIEHFGEARQAVLARFPGMAPAWAKWKNQVAAGTISCPGWCETCAGDRLLITETNGRTYATPCTACRRAA